MTPLPPKPTEDEALQDAIVEVSRWLERSMDASEKRALQTVLNAAEDGVRDNRRALAKAVREKNKQIETLSAALQHAEDALTRIAAKAPRDENSVHGIRQRCRHCGCANHPGKEIEHSSHCAWIIARAALSGVQT